MSDGDLMKQGKPEAAQLLGVNHKTMTAALDSGVLTLMLSDALEKVRLALDDLRVLVDRREDRRKWDLKGVAHVVPFGALPKGGLLCCHYRVQRNRLFCEKA